MRNEYPEFVFEQTDQAHPEFVKVITQAANALDFDGPLFSRVGRNLLRGVRQVGAGTIFEAVRDIDRQQQRPLATSHYLNTICFVGEAVFETIPKDAIAPYVPENNVHMVPHGHVIRVIFEALSETAGGYYSARKPQLKCPDGKSRIVAFSHHAIEQMCTRILTGWMTYRGLGDCYAILANCIYFAPARLPSGQFAFTFFDACPAGFWAGAYVTELLGASERVWESDLYYRLGYCPVDFAQNDKFITAKTFLSPGFIDTPEADALNRATISATVKKSLLSRAQQFSPRRYMENTDDFSVVKWFHDHGVPQLVRFPFAVYDDSPIHPREGR